MNRNISHLLIATFLLVFLAACQNSSDTKSSAFLQTQQELTEKLTAISKEANFNGFGVALVNEKEVLYTNGFGISNISSHHVYDQYTVQNIASVSKTILGIALLKAQELGKLKLDDDIQQYLPFKVINPYYPESIITIRHLATHTSSITDTEEYLTRNIILKDTVNLAANMAIDISPTKFNSPLSMVPMETFLRNILTENGEWYQKEGFLNHAPGTHFNYSNVGTALAALVLEKATGISYDQFTTSHILIPLKMNHTGWSFKTIDFSKYTQTFSDLTTAYPYYSLITYPDGGLLTTAADMSKFISELMKGYLGTGTLLTTDSYREYFTPQLKDENFTDRVENEYSDEYNMGITMGFGSTGNFGHTGGDPGLFSVIWFDKNQKTGRYFIINTDWNGELTGKYQKKIYELLDEYLIKLNDLSIK